MLFPYPDNFKIGPDQVYKICLGDTLIWPDQLPPDSKFWSNYINSPSFYYTTIDNSDIFSVVSDQIQISNRSVFESFDVISNNYGGEIDARNCTELLEFKSSNIGLLGIQFSGCNNLYYIDISNNPLQDIINFKDCYKLYYIKSNDTNIKNVILNNCTNLYQINFKNCKLSQSTVDYILYQVTLSTFNPADLPGEVCTIDLSGVNNAAPSQTGLIHKNTILSKFPNSVIYTN